MTDKPPFTLVDPQPLTRPGPEYEIRRYWRYAYAAQRAKRGGSKAVAEHYLNALDGIIVESRFDKLRLAAAKTMFSLGYTSAAASLLVSPNAPRTPD